MIQSKRHLTSAAIIVAYCMLGGCGWGLWGGGGGGGGNNNKVEVTGTLRDISPVTARDIVVFVYNVDDNNGKDGKLCPCPALPCDLSSGQAVVVESGDDTFSVDRIHDGAIRVVFLLDNAGDDADGQIDHGDLVAVLDDTDCELDDVLNKRTVTLEDIDLDFEEIDLDAIDARCDNNDDSTTTTDDEDSCENGNAPAPGRARADDIRITETVNNNNNNDDEN